MAKLAPNAFLTRSCDEWGERVRADVTAINAGCADIGTLRAKGGGHAAPD